MNLHSFVGRRVPFQLQTRTVDEEETAGQTVRPRWCTGGSWSDSVSQ